MAYFLKRTNNKKGTYLQVYESFYDPARRGTAHRSVRPVGYVHEIAERDGIADPVAHWRAEVDRMNAERREAEGRRPERVGGTAPEANLGHFALAAVDRALGAAADVSLLGRAAGLRFDLGRMLSDLALARAVAPCSKRRTLAEAVPSLAGEHGGYSLDQLYDGVAFLGRESRKVVEAYNDRVAGLLGRDTSRCFFDCTNFYFEIDREDSLRRKGPSKERRTDPIVGLGLMLDADMLPVGMEVFPGNASERPVMRSVVEGLRRRGGVEGRTVLVADKGLNCADNVAAAVLAGDGYIFSKSVKTLPAAELAWVLSEDGWEDVTGADGRPLHRLKAVDGDFAYRVGAEGGGRREAALPERRVATFNPRLREKQLAEIGRQVDKAASLRLSGAKRSEYGDCARYVTFEAVDGGGEVREDAEVVVTLDRAAIGRARRLAGYNLLVTSERSMPAAEVYRVYHELWRIEETFRQMKTHLEARPVYLQRPDSIRGHFLVCYVSVLLERILQLKVLGGRFGTEEVIRFVRDLRAVRASPRRNVNVARSSPVIDELERVTGLPLGNLYLSGSDVRVIAGYRFTPEQLRGSA